MTHASAQRGEHAAAMFLSAGAPLVLACGLAHAGAVSFDPIGFLDTPTSTPGSMAAGVSPDGTRIYGTSILENEDGGRFWQPIVWTSGGLSNLGVPVGGVANASAARSSIDNSVVVGSVGVNFAGNQYEARNGAFWTGATTSPSPNRVAPVWYFSGVSGDGQVFSGLSRAPGPLEPNPSSSIAVRYSATDGYEELGVLPGGSFSGANAISRDGKTIVGYGDAGPAGYITAFVWTRDTGMHTLPGQQDLVPTEARAVSNDGSVICGLLDTHVFRWTAADGMVDLGAIDDDLMTPQAMSGDGNAIVGDAFNDGKLTAFLWTSSLGLVNLQDYLSDLGLDLSGWSLQEATGISDDGLVISGYGINPDGLTEGWAVRVPGPGVPAAASALGLILLRRRR